MRRNNRSLVSLVPALVLAASPIVAPAPAAAQVSEAAAALKGRASREREREQLPAPAATSDDGRVFAPASPADREIGKQAIAPAAPALKPRFRARVDVSGNWTSNAASTDRDEIDDRYLRFGGAFSVTQPLSDRLFLGLGVAQSLYRYDRTDRLDFESFHVDPSAIFVVPELGDLNLFGGYRYWRFTEGNLRDEFLSSHTLFLGAQKAFEFGKAHRLTLGATADLDLDADPGSLARRQYGAQVEYGLQISRPLALSLFYSFYCQDYRSGGREDLTHIVGGEIAFRPCRWLVLRGVVDRTFNESNRALLDYEAWEAALQLAVELAF